MHPTTTAPSRPRSSQLRRLPLRRLEAVRRQQQQRLRLRRDRRGLGYLHVGRQDVFQLQEVHRKLRVRLSGREVRHQHVLRLWDLHHGFDGLPEHGFGWAYV
jgi:hypothetical protein